MPLSPQVRRIVGALALGGGVLVVGRVVMPSVPRDVDVAVHLGAFREPPLVARALSVTLVRDGATVRRVSARFGVNPPVEWRQTLAVAPGNYRAVVEVEFGGRVATRETDVRIEPGAVVAIPAPIP
jgi:hypothetical protein